MKANRLAKDEGGDFGIGVMIIFIAMIVVAVVAATVIIETMNALQGRAYNTANDATQMVSCGLEIRSVTMERIGGFGGGLPLLGSGLSSFTQGFPTGLFETPEDTAQTLRITLQLRAGSVPIDLNKVLVTIVTSTKAVKYSGDNSLGTLRKFDAIVPIRDDDGSLQRDSLTNLGDVAEIVLNVRDLNIGPGDRFQIRIFPDVGGVATSAHITMPLSYANEATTVMLYP